MSEINLKAYYENIEKKTGKTPADFRTLAEEKGFVINGAVKSNLKAGEVMDWLKEDFKLGRGHALAIYHFIKTQAE